MGFCTGTHNFVIDENHPINAVVLGSLPLFWFDVVNGGFIQVKKHMEKAVKRPTDSQSILAAESMGQQRVKNLQQSSIRPKLKWYLQDKKILDKTIEELSTDSDALWSSFNRTSWI